MSAALPAQFDKQSRSSVRAIVEFFVLTYVVSWAFFTAGGYVLGRIPSDKLISGFLFLGGTIVPSLVAIALTARNAGRKGVGTLLQGVTKWRVGLRWYVLALSYMAVIKLAAALLNRLTLGTWPRFGQVPWYLIIVAIMFSTPVQAGEEIGWRGYALPRLTKQFGLAGASIVLGVIWACWHLPFFFIPGSDNFGQPFLLYLMAVTAISVAMARHRTVARVDCGYEPFLPERVVSRLARSCASLDRRCLFPYPNARRQSEPFQPVGLRRPCLLRN